jgi:hypothetical protein
MWAWSNGNWDHGGACGFGSAREAASAHARLSKAYRASARSERLRRRFREDETRPAACETQFREDETPPVGAKTMEGGQGSGPQCADH